MTTVSDGVSCGVKSSMNKKGHKPKKLHPWGYRKQAKREKVEELSNSIKLDKCYEYLCRSFKNLFQHLENQEFKEAGELRDEIKNTIERHIK